MGNRGRFGKYGDIKRLARLRRARMGAHGAHGVFKSLLKEKLLFKRPDHERSAVKIRMAEPSDGPFIARLSNRVFSVYGPYEDSISHWFSSQEAITLIALMHERSVGFAMLGRSPQGASELLAIAVEPEAQGLGIGRALIHEVEKRAKKMDIRRLYLHTARENSRAIGLFMKNGYQPLGIKKEFYPKGQDAMLMEKEIGE